VDEVEYFEYVIVFSLLIKWMNVKGFYLLLCSTALRTLLISYLKVFK